MDPPCPIRCVPAPWAAYATESGPFLATRHNAPPSPRTSDRTSTNPTAHSHPASASAVYVRIPSTMEHHRESPDSSFTIKNTPDGPSTRNTSAKAADTSVDRLESGDDRRTHRHRAAGKHPPVALRSARRRRLRRSSGGWWRRSQRKNRSCRQTPAGRVSRNCPDSPRRRILSSTRASGSGDT